MKIRHVVAIAFLAAIGTFALPEWASSAKAAPAHHDGDGHRHGSEGGHLADEHKGAKQDLGIQKIGSYDVQVTLVGEVKPGEEAIFIITPKGEGEPKSVRAWVGVESGKGSIRTKADEEKEGEWHAHHKVSKPLPASSKLWVELELATDKVKGSFELKKAQ